jgi:hypothetical protein
VKRVIHLLAGALLVSAWASAAPVNDQVCGVWSGTVGAATVTACMTTEGKGTSKRLLGQ